MISARLTRNLMRAGCVLALALGGCAGTGEGGSDLSTQSLASDRAVAQPVPQGKARLVLSRPGGLLYAGTAATVKVNGAKVAELWGSATQTVDIAPGKVTIAVDAWAYPGSWTEELSAVAGGTYNIEVAARSDGVGTAVMFGAIGGAVEAQNNPKSGLFQWTLKKHTAAQVAAAPAAAPAKQAKSKAAAPPKQ